MTSTHAPPGSTGVEPRRAGVWMTRALALVLGVYALFSCWTLFYNLSPIAAAVACVLGAAAVGLWRMRPWSRWIVYSISAVLGAWFVWYVSKLVQGGWPYEDGTRSLLAVLPASLLMLCGIAAAVHVKRVFDPR